MKSQIFLGIDITNKKQLVDSMEQKDTIIKQGYSAMTEMLGSDQLIWSMEDEGKTWPDLYPTENDVWKSYADDLMEQLKQFQNDEREFDEVDWEPQIYPVYVKIYESGKMEIYSIGHTMVAKEHSTEQLSIIEELDIADWRQSL